MSASNRAVVYLLLLGLFVVVTFLISGAAFEASTCNDSEDSHCDVAVLAGFVMAFWAVVVGVILIVISELVVSYRGGRRVG